MITLKKAKTEDFEKILSLYDNIIDKMVGLPTAPDWERGVYPTDEFIAESIKNGELFYGEINGEMVSVGVLNNTAIEDYKKVGWKAEAEEEKIVYLHVFGVKYEYQSKGVGRETVRLMIEQMRKDGKKVIRLDAMKKNTPAQKLYESVGFDKVEECQLYYVDTGIADFVMYEIEL